MKDLEGCGIEEVAFLVCTAMKNAGVTAVLTGGGAASIYAPRAYRTRDLDFVLHYAVSMPSAAPILALGFSETRTRGTYSHPDLEFTLEFFPGPLAVCDEELTAWDTWERDDRTLYIVSPFDCVRDRMAAAIYWHDPNSARQAAAVARQRTIDTHALKAWCLEEGGSTAFALFEAYLRAVPTEE